MTAPASSRPVRRSPLRRRGAARVIPESAPALPDDAGFVEHPDGWYWLAAGGHQQFGPFASLSLARADRDRQDSEAVNEAEAEREAEQAMDLHDAIHGDEADGPGPDDAAP